MAVVDFPNAPNVDDVFTGPNGATYRWDGEVWILLAAPLPLGERVTTVPMPVHFFNNIASGTWQTVASTPVNTRGGLLLVVAMVGGNVQGLATQWVGGAFWYGINVDHAAAPQQQWRYDAWSGPLPLPPLVATIQPGAGTHDVAFQIQQSGTTGNANTLTNVITSTDNPGFLTIVEFP